MKFRLSIGVVLALVCALLFGASAQASPPSAVDPGDGRASTSVGALPGFVDDTIWPPLSADERNRVATTASYIVGNGSDWWYGLAWTPWGYKNAVYIRYSWSTMWYAKTHMNTFQVAATTLCGTILKEPRLLTSCGALIAAYFYGIRYLVNTGLATHRCLRVRFPAPPLFSAGVYQYILVTCRI